MDIEDGGTAFPTYGYSQGMTLRDWFAGQSLAGLRAQLGSDDTYDLGMIAYKDADNMLKARG